MTDSGTYTTNAHRGETYLGVRAERNTPDYNAMHERGTVFETQLKGHDVVHEKMHRRVIARRHQMNEHGHDALKECAWTQCTEHGHSSPTISHFPLPIERVKSGLTFYFKFSDILLGLSLTSCLKNNEILL